AARVRSLSPRAGVECGSFRSIVDDEATLRGGLKCSHGLSVATRRPTLTAMSWVDLIIAIVVVLAGFLGLADGAVRQILRFTGFAAGFFLGTLLAPSLSSHI